ncbi:MAG: amidase [Burkholderiaceae bacterium]
MSVEDLPNAFVPYPPAHVAQAPPGPHARPRLGVKDLFDVAGYPTGAGSPTILALSGIKTGSAHAVKQLLAAGAHFAGKTHTDEFAFSVTGRNAHFGTPRNGAAPDRIPGGSSSGSASAVSNGLCDFALGTDTGGSVRAPASNCGLWGLRPTHGRISLDGVWPLAPSFDTCGFLAREIDVMRRVGAVLLGEDPNPLPAAVRLLDAQDAWTGAEPAVRAALEPARAAVVAAVRASPEPTALAPEGFEPLLLAFRRLQGAEAWASDGELIERHGIPLGPGVAERFAWSRVLDPADVEEARRMRVQFREALELLLGRDGVLMLPTMPDVAPLLVTDESTLDAYRQRAIAVLSAASLAGVPQLSMPLGQIDGVPIGLSLIAPRGADRSLLDLAGRIASVVAC